MVVGLKATQWEKKRTKGDAGIHPLRGGGKRYKAVGG